MTAKQAALEKKMAQTKFFLARLNESRENEAERDSYFSAFLSAFRSVVLYVRSGLEKEGRISKSNTDWVAKIKPWEATLPSTEREKWECLTRLRNTDTHEEPVVPEEVRRAGIFPVGYFPAGMFPTGYLLDGISLVVFHPKTGTKCDLIDLCNSAVQVAERLVAEYVQL